MREEAGRANSTPDASRAQPSPTPATNLADSICPKCGTDLSEDKDYQVFHICGQCRYHFIISAAERIALLTDKGSFQEMDARLQSIDPLHFDGQNPYRNKLVHAQEETGLRDVLYYD